MAARRRRTVLLVVLVLFAALAVYLLAWPIGKLDPLAWTPPHPKTWTPNELLAGAAWLHKDLPGPEAVAFDSDGRIVTGLADGRVVRFAPDGQGTPELLAQTGGRPLGVRFDASGKLIVADAYKGLLAITDGKPTILATEAGGVPFAFTDDVTIAQDGTIYFTDASSRWPVAKFTMDILEHRGSGRLLAFHPDTGKTEVLLKDLYFANGVALGPDDAFVLVTETSSYRVRRYWLRGERAGQNDVFIDNLPGFPDNLTWSPTRQVFWVAIGSPRDPILDKLGPYPLARKMVARLPKALQPAAKRHAWVIGLDAKGTIVSDLQHVSPSSYSPIASVVEHDGWLYLGSFARGGIARVKAP